MTGGSFAIEARDGDARAGYLRTPHGEVPTPAFMPVATQGSVKSLDPRDLEAVGARIVLGNAYHLYLRPGAEAIQRLGGIHSFMGWPRPVLTDSGGFQGFSLEHLRKVTEDGITFKSHIDGSIHELTPESAVWNQERIGADIIMPLDVCPPATARREEVASAVDTTGRWAVRCLAAASRPDQMLFGIVQGGMFPDLRERSADFLVSLGLPGYAIGGVSVGETKNQIYETTAATTSLLPSDKPRYLMGVGSPDDLVEAIAAGVDMLDCALPTRVARNGAVFTRGGRVNVYSAPFRGREGPVEEGCDCYACGTFSAAYINHLFRSKELLAYRLATIHNLRFVLRLMEEMRAAIVDGSFHQYRKRFRTGYAPPDHTARQKQREKQTAFGNSPALRSSA